MATLFSRLLFISAVSVFDHVEQQEVVDTTGYDLRRRRRRSPSANDLDVRPSSSQLEMNTTKSFEDSSIPSPRNTEYDEPPLSTSDDKDDHPVIYSGVDVQRFSGRVVDFRHSSDDRISRHLVRLDDQSLRVRHNEMRSGQLVVASQRVERSSWSLDNDDVRVEEVHVEKFALDELSDKVKRMIGSWSSSDNREQTLSDGPQVESSAMFDDSRKHTNLEIQLASWGAYIVLPAMIVFIIINCYCCCKIFYMGGWAWPIKKVGRGIVQRYVAGVRTTSTGKMVFEGLTDAEIKANAHVKVLADAVVGLASTVTKPPNMTLKKTPSIAGVIGEWEEYLTH